MKGGGDPTERVAHLTSEDFSAIEGTRATVEVDGNPLAFTVVAVEVAPGSRGRCFSVFFSAPEPRVLPQAIYHLRHAELGELALFLVPIGIEAEPGPGSGIGAVRYEAVFNRSGPDATP